MKFVKAMLALTILVSLATGALASGTLADNGIPMLTFADGTAASGGTHVSADNDGTYIWTAAGGWSDGLLLARYDQSGNNAQTYNAGIDFRSLFVDNGGQLYACSYTGGIYSLTQNGVPTLMFDLSEPDSQGSASFNADDSELLMLANGSVYRFNAANGAAMGNFALVGYGSVGSETNYPDNIQMETNGTGRILTYTGGIVSEWDYAGNRVGQCTIPLSTPNDFDTIFSFGVGNDNLVYFYNPSTGNWESYDVGIIGNTAVQGASWSEMKALY